jgi:glucosamine-6-phosphate deaminase
MDEFLGLPESHTASFGRFLNQYLLTRIPVRAAHKIRGDALQPLRECARYEALLKESQIDLCCLGVGENGHIAFNDPDVADFEEKSWVKLVKMDDRCRLQQVKDKVFNTINDVPSYAYTLTIPALMSARQIVGIVPGSHKAEAVAKMLQNPVSTTCPASALRHHPKAELHLDAHAAERLLIA